MSFATEVAKHINAPLVLVDVYFNSGTRYYSNTYVNVYRGKVLNLPQIRASVGDVKRTYEKNRITIIFSDSDYEFRGLEDTETVGFRNIRVVMKVGFSDGSTLTTSTLFDGQIYDWKRLDNLQFEIDVEEKGKNLDNEYPEMRVELGDWANAHSTAVGCVVPILFGTISALGLSNDGAWGHPALTLQTGLPFVDTTVDAERHLVGMAGYNKAGGVIAVPRVYKNGVLQTSAVDYDINSATIWGTDLVWLIDWRAGARPTETDFISCDIQCGARYGAVQSIVNFLTQYCGYVIGDFNPTRYVVAQELDFIRGYYMDGAIWQRASLRSLLDMWREEFAIDVYWDKDGLICMDYLSATYATSSNHYKDYLDILSGNQSEPQVDELLNKLRYGYNYNYSKTYFYNYGTKEDAASQTKYAATFEKYSNMYFTRSAAQSYDFATRKIIRFKEPICFEKYRLPLKTYQDNLTDLIRITHFEGTGSAGYSNRLLQLREFNYDPNNFTNEALFEDIINYTGRACILGDDTVLAASWATADADDRQYCYLCDSGTGQFADGEPGKMLVD